jgi:hypothetical protein
MRAAADYFDRNLESPIDNERIHPMQTKDNYEDLLLKELQGIPWESMPEVIKIIRSVKLSILAARQVNGKPNETSSLCGAWQDDRKTEEIIEGIYSHRTGFDGRGIVI